MGLERLFLAVLIASLVGFGGLSSLPILRSELLHAGLPADTLLLHSLAVGQISPGPNGLYLIAVGYFVAGFAGVGVTVLAILLPPLLVLVLERARSRLFHLQRVRAALHSLSLAVVALLAVSGAKLAIHAATDAVGVIMVGVGVLVLLRGMPSLYGIAVAVVAGLFVR